MKEKDYSKSIEVFSGSPWEAEIIKGLLESNDIRCVVKDGIMGTLAPYIAPAVSILSQRRNMRPPQSLSEPGTRKIATDTVESFLDILQRVSIGETHVSFPSCTKVHSGSNTDMRMLEYIECKAIRVGSKICVHQRKYKMPLEVPP